MRVLPNTLLVALVLALILVPFFWFGDAVEARTEAALGAGGAGAVAGIVVAVLALDVLLPVPSSLVSLAAGAAMGPAAGAAAIWVGMTLGCLLGWAVGRGVLGPLDRRMARGADAGQSARIARDWGWAGLVLFRPVPVLAEASVLIGAASGMALGRLLAVTALANLPVALLYGYFGSLLAGEVPVLYLLAAALAVVVAGLLLRRMGVWGGGRADAGGAGTR